MKFLFPHIYAKSIKHVPYEKLLQKNIKAIIFDIDNTLVPHDMKHAPKELISFLSDIKKMGFKIVLLSNNNKNRVLTFNKPFSFYAVYNAKKPRSYGINKALNMLNLLPHQTAIVGDQIFTDVWCGNKNGMVTILTRPITSRDTFGVFLKRGIERCIVKKFVKSVRC